MKFGLGLSRLFLSIFRSDFCLLILSVFFWPPGNRNVILSRAIENSDLNVMAITGSRRCILPCRENCLVYCVYSSLSQTMDPSIVSIFTTRNINPKVPVVNEKETA